MRLGVCSGVFYALILILGNVVLTTQDERILALKLPFAALSAGLGKTGFYMNTGLGWMFCVFSLTGLIRGLLPVLGSTKTIGK